VVDDDESSREMLARRLPPIRLHRFRSCPSGGEWSRPWLAASSSDLVLLDMIHARASMDSKSWAKFKADATLKEGAGHHAIGTR